MTDRAEEVEFVLREARANITELSDDLKGFYIPEKGWPAHIDRAAEVSAEIDDLLAVLGEADND